jgi:colanic acid/amylovoran biosynthesis glycosyltransferase
MAKAMMTSNCAINKIAYLMSRFPKLTETFILYEILALERFGITIEIFPLLKERQNISHPEAQRLAERAHYQPFISVSILAAQWYFIRRRPGAYFKVWGEVLRGTFGSANFFLAP